MAGPLIASAAGAFAALRTKAPRILRLPDFRGNFTTGSTIVANLPVGLTYHAFMIQFVKAANVPATEAEISAQIGRIRITMDGDPKIDLIGTEAVMFANLYNGRGLASPVINGGVLPIYLARPYWPEFASQDGPAWGTADVGSLTVEVTFTGAVTIVAAVIRGMVTAGEPLGRHITIRRLVDSQAAAGLKSLADFKPDVTKQLLAVHIDKAGGIQSGPITSFQVKADQRVEWEGEYEALTTLYRCYELNPQSAWTHFVFVMRGRPLDSLPMVMQDLRLELTTSSALTTFNALCEYAEGTSPGEA